MSELSKLLAEIKNTKGYENAENNVDGLVRKFYELVQVAEAVEKENISLNKSFYRAEELIHLLYESGCLDHSREKLVQNWTYT
jgi:hypothetical protein